jgi:hypothetical protein
VNRDLTVPDDTEVLGRIEDQAGVFQPDQSLNEEKAFEAGYQTGLRSRGLSLSKAFPE